MSAEVLEQEEIVYPDGDGQPMSDNTVQFDWILHLTTNLRRLYADRPEVFVSGNQFWYPRERQPKIVQAPDVYVVFDALVKESRPSWKQWEEDDRAMTVVMEIVSPTNPASEMPGKVLFYEQYGSEECYVYDPDRDSLDVFVRTPGGTLKPRHFQGSFTSPLLGVRFDLSDPERGMAVFFPDGSPFLTPEEMERELRAGRQARQDALDARKEATDAERRAADAERKADDAEKKTADAEKKTADAEKKTADAERLAARLKELSRKARRSQASAEELTELDRLEGE